MSKSKSKSAKAAPKAKSNPRIKSKPADADVATIATECPRGGSHEWKEEDGERFCGKCQEPEPATAKKQRAKSKSAAKQANDGQPKKLSAINAAAQVLAASDKPLNCQELIATMAEQKLWSSPGGETPAQTLYSAILREISTKGKDSRFVKTERGKFSIAAAK